MIGSMAHQAQRLPPTTTNYHRLPPTYVAVLPSKHFSPFLTLVTFRGPPIPLCPLCPLCPRCPLCGIHRLQPSRAPSTLSAARTDCMVSGMWSLRLLQQSCGHRFAICPENNPSAFDRCWRIQLNHDPCNHARLHDLRLRLDDASISLVEQSNQ